MKTIQVTIPAGVDTGDNMRLSGQGNAGRLGGKAGNLYVKIRVQNDDVFHRDGSDLHIEVPLTISQSVLGDKVKVPTIDGPYEINVKEGTQPGDLFTIRSKGVPRTSGLGRGSQICHFNVKIPTYILFFIYSKLSEKQKELIKEFSKTEEECYEKHHNPKGILGSVVDKFKNYWKK